MRCVLRFVVVIALLPATGALAADSADQLPEYPPPAAVKAAFLKLLDRPKVDAEPKVIDEPRTAAGLVTEHFSIGTERKADGSMERMPVMIVRPEKAAGRLPAVVVLHGTGGNKESYRGFCGELAKRGMIGVAIDARYHGERIPGGAHGSKEYVAAVTRAWRAKPGEPQEHPFYFDTCWDLWRLVDYLQTRDDIDPQRIGMYGVSMGAIEIWLAASVDNRVRVVVPAIGVQSLRWTLEHDMWQGRAGTIQGAHEAAAKDLGEQKVNTKVCRDLWNKVVPGILDQFDCPSMIRLFAGRPMLITSGEKDPNNPLGGAKLAFASAEQAYKAAGAADKLKIDVAPGIAHQVTDAQRAEGIEWLAKWLAAGDDGFKPMFDGKTLDGWVNVNCAPGTFFMKDGEIVTTGKPTGFMRTARHYENFIAEFDWMHVPPTPGAVGNSGFFVWADPIPAAGTPFTRGVEVQVLVNLTHKNDKGVITATSQGDLFSIWGATCKPDRPHPDGWERCLPSENHAKGDREWNHYRVTANDGRITLAVNGHEVSGVSQTKPRKGFLCLESEGSECHFKNLLIKELPSTNPKPDEIGDEDKGFKNLYTGLDLSGWKASDAAKQHWQPNDWMLHYDGKGAASDSTLRTEKDFAAAEFFVDFRFPDKRSKPCTFIVGDSADSTARITVSPEGKVEVSLKASAQTAAGNDAKTAASSQTATVVKGDGDWRRLIINGAITGKTDASANQKMSLAIQPGSEMDFANLFVRELK